MVDTGIGVFRFCDKLINDLPDLLMTAELFLGGFGLNPNIPIFGSKPPMWMQEANVNFILEATGYQYEVRPNDVIVDIDPTLIHSGDFFAVTRFDGLDQIIEYGTGSHSGHSVIALWLNGTLNICESQAGWYWPRSGIQCNPWSQWLIWANNADFHVTWLPLKAEYAAKFNETSAQIWVEQNIGYPYGYFNFIFGWIDTTNASFPPLLSPQLVGPVFSLVEYISPLAGDLVTLGLNFRLGTTNLTMPELYQALYELDMTFEQGIAIVEQDSWVYPDGPNMVCSSFVVGVWRAGGLFDDMTIQVTEFTPRDVYEMEFLEKAPVLPANCTLADPINPHCQIMGKWRMQFPNIGTVSPYANMNEHCDSFPPEYQRIPANC